MADQDWQHLVVIIGGAVAGSEAAFQLTQRGVLCVVVEQNDRPYGKVEDGLPRWHEKLRLQEEKKIDDKLSHPTVYFVPRTKVGVDLMLDEILSWGVSAVVFADGAWRDRPLPLPRIDQFIGKGFCYQNALVVSSIGSTPEPIPGIQMKGEVYRIRDESTGEVEGHERVFAIGNAVTGRGNILASRRHGRVVSQHMLEHYLQGTASGYEEVLEDAASEMAAKMGAVMERLARQAPPSPETVTAALARVKALQKRVGYSDTYAQWIERVRPPLV